MPHALHSQDGVAAAIEAGGDLEGLDVLCCAHAARALSYDARHTHLLPHVDLKPATGPCYSLSALENTSIIYSQVIVGSR